MNTQFEERLLDELNQVVRDNPAPARGTVPGRRPVRRFVLAGGLAAAVVGLLSVNVDHAATAYAVAKGADGTVTVTVSSVRDAEGLERALEAAGIDTRVAYAEGPEACAALRDDADPDAARPTMTSQTGGGAEPEAGARVESSQSADDDDNLAAEAKGSILVIVSPSEVTFTISKEAVPEGAQLSITATECGGLSSMQVGIARG